MATLAPRPAATLAALAPTTPPPRMTTLAGSTPGTPPSRMPRPSKGRSRYFAPSWMLMRPATSLVGGEVEIGEDDLPRPHQRPLDRQRLLDLDDQVGVPPDVGGGGDNFGAMLGVVVVADAGALAGAGLDQDPVAG